MCRKTAFTWLLTVSFLLSPFIFNPSVFEWLKFVKDWKNWRKWLTKSGGPGLLDCFFFFLPLSLSLLLHFANYELYVAAFLFF